MSLQLIIYPQSYEGIYSTISTPVYTQYVPDHSFNLGTLVYNWAVDGDNSNPIYTATQTVPPVYAWSAYYIDPTGTSFIETDPPTLNGNTAVLHSPTSSTVYGISGLFCTMNGLTPGHVYDVEVDLISSSSTSYIWTGTSLGSWSTCCGIFHSIPYDWVAVGAAVSGIQSSTFTATHATMVFSIHYANKDNTDCTIQSVSVRENAANVPTDDVYEDGQVICDLYTDESIPLTLSIDDFKNVSAKTQSYSKAFNLPTTKKNNKIFSSLYDVTRSVKDDGFSFNPYKKTKAVLKEDGYTVFDGFLRLIDISETEEETSYNVNLYSDIVSLKDSLGSKKFKDLNNGLTELTHEYHKSNIKASWGGNLVLLNALAADSFAGSGTTTDVLKYPFCNYHGNILLSSGSPQLTLLEDAFRPWIRCKYLVDRIISEAGFTYDSTFLNTTDFTKLFMDFNWGADNAPPYTSGSSYTVSTKYSNYTLGTDGGGYTNHIMDFPAIWDVDTTFWITIFATPEDNKFVCTQDNMQVNFNYHFYYYIDGAQTLTVDRRIKVTRADGSIEIYNQASPATWTASTSNPHWYGNFDMLFNEDDELCFQISWTATGGGAASEIFLKGYLLPESNIILTRNIVSTSSNNVLNSLRGELKQWDFFKGLMDMFNLMVMRDKQNPTNLLIEPYKDIFVENADIETHDWTDKVDVSEINLEPLDLKQKLLFKYQDDKKDYGVFQYLAATGSNYGEAVVDASSFTMLTGEEKVEAKPFAATFIKPLFDNFTDELTVPIMYEVKEDGTSTGLKNKPRILYDVSADLSGGKRHLGAGVDYFIPAQAGYYSENQEYFGQFAHVTDIPTTLSSKDYNFGSSQLITSIGSSPVDNLFNVYWSPYYDELYNPDTRIMKLKVFLNSGDIANFNFYDIVRIKNREYRVNKIDYTSGELSKVEFILIG